MALNLSSGALKKSIKNSGHVDSIRYNPIAKPHQAISSSTSSTSSSSSTSSVANKAKQFSLQNNANKIVKNNGNSALTQQQQQQQLNRKAFQQNSFPFPTSNILQQPQNDFYQNTLIPGISSNPLAELSASSLASLISLTSSGQLQLIHPQLYVQPHLVNHHESAAAASLLARLAPSLINSFLPYAEPAPPCNISTNMAATAAINSVNNNNNNHQQHDQWQSGFDTNSLRLLTSLYDMNDEPDDDAIKLIAERINSTFSDVANYFYKRREAERNSVSSLSSVDWSTNSNKPAIPPNNVPCISPFESEKSHPPSAPSSTLLAKLTAVTSRPNAHITAKQLDQKMVELLEAFYIINDNPEPSAIEMIAKRINSSIDLVADWFDSKRAELNPHAGPRSPPAKKREGGRVVTFSEYQRSLLEAIFDENNYLHPQEYEELSNLIQVPARNIKIWFKNRRSKQRLSGRITTPVGANHLER